MADRLTPKGTYLLSAAMIRPIVAAVVMLLVACGGDPVGRICDLGGQEPPASEVVVSSPALDCVSRTCLRVPLSRDLPPGSVYPDGDNGLCTAECSTDDDCDRVPESPCITGFTCAIAVTVGPFCCKRFCECKDYVVVPASGKVDDPMACDAGNAANACCNLEGRAGNSAYPLCNI
jgi:hypothetical protein